MNVSFSKFKFKVVISEFRSVWAPEEGFRSSPWHTHFTHCYVQVLNLVLAQGMNDIPECNSFFSTLQGISTFSSHSSKRKYAVQEYLQALIPSFAPTRWCFTSRLVNIVMAHYDKIKSLFASIHMNMNGDWNVLDRCVAKGFELFLEKFETVLLMNLFC